MEKCKVEIFSVPYWHFLRKREIHSILSELWMIAYVGVPRFLRILKILYSDLTVPNQSHFLPSG